MQEILIQHVEKALSALGIDNVEVELEYPADLDHGDFSTNAALVGAKTAGENPKELAEKIVSELEDIENVEKIEVAGPGFINFTLVRSYFADTVHNVDDAWGRNKTLNGRRIIIEYVNANSFKELHIGHLMGASIGESLSRIFEFSSAEIKRESYGGDVGPHAAKAVYGIQQLGEGVKPEIIGKAYALGAQAYESNEEAKQAIDAINKHIYEEDSEEIKAIHNEGIEASIKSVEPILDFLGTKLDRFIFESESAPYGLELVEEGLEKGVFEESDGAVVYKGEEKGLHTRVFRTSKHTPTYEAKELGLETVKDAWWKHDASIILTANEQKSYFQVVLAALQELRPEQAQKVSHVSHGMLRLAEGKMSSRTGDIITAKSFIEKTTSAVEQVVADRDLGDSKKEIVDAVAVAAIKYAILKQSSGRDVVYDEKSAVSFEGDSGPYLQYAYVRALSVLKKANKQDIQQTPEFVPEFERLLPRFPSVVERAAREYEPHYITTYLTRLAGAFNSWYAQGKIIGSEHEVYKLALTSAFAHTMKNGLWLLGIEAPEKM